VYPPERSFRDCFLAYFEGLQGFLRYPGNGCSPGYSRRRRHPDWGSAASGTFCLIRSLDSDYPA